MSLSLPPLTSIPLSSSPSQQLSSTAETNVSISSTFIPDEPQYQQQQTIIIEKKPVIPTVPSEQHEQSPPTKVRKTTRQPRKKATNEPSLLSGFAGSLIDLAAAASLFQEQVPQVTLPPEHDIWTLYNPLSAVVVDPFGAALTKRETSVMHERLLRRKRLIDRLTVPKDMTSVTSITTNLDAPPSQSTTQPPPSPPSPSSQQQGLTSQTTQGHGKLENVTIPQFMVSPPSVMSISTITDDTITSPSLATFTSPQSLMPSVMSIPEIAKGDDPDDQGKRRKKKPSPSTGANNNSNIPGGVGDGGGTETKQKRCHEVLRDDEGRPILPVTVFKGLIVNSLGEVTLNPTFQTKKYILPVGFRSTRTYSSLSDMDKKATYVNEILEDAGGHPVFRVTCQESDRDPEVFVADTSSGVWAKIGKRINECKEAVIGKKNFTQLSGPEMFGYGHPTVIRLLQELPGVEKLTKYETQTFEVKGLKGAKKAQSQKQKQSQNQQPNLTQQ